MREIVMTKRCRAEIRQAMTGKGANDECAWEKRRLCGGNKVLPKNERRVCGLNRRKFNNKDTHVIFENAIDIAVVFTTVLLNLSKIPDVVTTYQFISRSGNPRLEKNRLAREVFIRMGLVKGLVLLCGVFIALTLISPLIYFQLGGFWRNTWGLTYFVYGLFVSVVQLQVAWFNARGVMLQPLRSVHRVLGWWYR